MNQGIKQACRKLIIPCLSLPVLSMPMLGCNAVFQASGSHILRVCCHHLQVFKVHEEYQSGLSSRIVFDLLKQRAQPDYLRATVHSLFLGTAPFLTQKFLFRQVSCIFINAWVYLLFLKDFEYFSSIKMKISTFFFKKKCIVVINYHGPRHTQYKHMSSAVDLQNLSENFCVEILKNLNSDKKMLNVLHRIS